MKNSFRAFTLIELSIVVVIIGLIVAGVVAGQSLVTQANLRKVISEAAQYKVAYNQFRLEYNAAPGDMINATSFWSGVANGNGNKAIDTYDEFYASMEHLALAGAIPGVYTGTHTSELPVAGVNSPATIRNAVWFINYWNAGNANPYTDLTGTSDLRNMVRIATITTGDTSAPDTPIFTQPEAYSIDLKTDDGLPGMGQTTAYNFAATSPSNCVSGTTTTAAIYAIATNDISCRLQFDLD